MAESPAAQAWGVILQRRREHCRKEAFRRALVGSLTTGVAVNAGLLALHQWPTWRRVANFRLYWFLGSSAFVAGAIVHGEKYLLLCSKGRKDQDVFQPGEKTKIFQQFGATPPEDVEWAHDGAEEL